MSPKNSSLAFDETLKEFETDLEIHFEPELKVFVNALYATSSSRKDNIVQVTGRITVSF